MDCTKLLNLFVQLRFVCRSVRSESLKYSTEKKCFLLIVLQLGRNVDFINLVTIC